MLGIKGLILFCFFFSLVRFLDYLLSLSKYSSSPLRFEIFNMFYDRQFQFSVASIFLIFIFKKVFISFLLRSYWKNDNRCCEYWNWRIRPGKHAIFVHKRQCYT